VKEPPIKVGPHRADWLAAAPLLFGVLCLGAISISTLVQFAEVSEGGGEWKAFVQLLVPLLYIPFLIIHFALPSWLFILCIKRENAKHVAIIVVCIVSVYFFTLRIAKWIAGADGINLWFWLFTISMWIAGLAVIIQVLWDMRTTDEAELD
jgi:hypothetical protein